MPNERDKASGLCPYCGREMEAGSILGTQYPVKWQPADRKLILGIWSTGHTIGDFSWLRRPRANGYRCADCKRVIVDE